jgi:hypothetical protein
MEQAAAVREIAEELNVGERIGRSTHLARLIGESKR